MFSDVWSENAALFVLKIDENSFKSINTILYGFNAAVTPSPKAIPYEERHAIFSQNGVGRGYFMAVTGSVWQLRGLSGNKGFKVALPGRLPCTPRNNPT